MENNRVQDSGAREQLRPCPFCGGEAWVIQILEDLYAVECRKCWTRTGTYQPTKAEAIEAWNRRAEPERKKGKWISGNGKDTYIHCSVCDKEAYWDTDYGQQEFDFCPYCGADMRGE